MATKKSTSKKATNKKATKKVAPKTTKHALIIEVSETNGHAKSKFEFGGDEDVLAMAISKLAHEDDNFRAFLYYLIKSIGAHSQELLTKTKKSIRAKNKK
jgi:hypothetical protein